MDKNVNSWPPNFKGLMCQQGGENFEVYQFHRDPWVSNCMGNMINQPVFAEKVLEKSHFLDFLGFQILHFQGNLTSLSQYGYYVVFFVLCALIWDIFNIQNALGFLIWLNMDSERHKFDPQTSVLLLNLIKLQ